MYQTDAISAVRERDNKKEDSRFILKILLKKLISNLENRALISFD
jgi:hypothetical protein